jgi:hypothetical protein
MKLEEQIFSKQISTSLTSNQYHQWQKLCKQEKKSSFILLREIVLAVLGKSDQNVSS